MTVTARGDDSWTPSGSRPADPPSSEPAASFIFNGAVEIRTADLDRPFLALSKGSQKAWPRRDFLTFFDSSVGDSFGRCGLLITGLQLRLTIERGGSLGE